MCGRFTLRDPIQAYRAFLRRQAAQLPEPKFNVAPGQMIPVIRMGENGQREVEELLWGLIPSWAKPDKKPAPIVNARAETAPDKPAFREAFRRRRCLVPADGFYEWRTANSRKVPYFFRLRGDKPFAFAAIWEEWRPKPDESARTFCLLTTDANPLLARIHDRMPVILNEDGAALWLQSPPDEAVKELAPLLRPFPAEEMEGTPVDPWVNKVDHEGPRCIEPRGDDEPEQLSLL